MSDIVKAIIEAIVRLLFSRWMKPKTPIQQVETAHDIEDKNRADLRDGDAAKRLLSDWSK